jgi:hypothetical protein
MNLMHVEAFAVRFVSNQAATAMVRLANASERAVLPAFTAAAISAYLSELFGPGVYYLHGSQKGNLARANSLSASASAGHRPPNGIGTSITRIDRAGHRSNLARL